MKNVNLCDTLSFQLKLLSSMKEIDRYPFTKLVIERNLTEREYDETMNLLQTLSDIYEAEREEGLLDYSSLLFHYAGMVCWKLPITQSLAALHSEGYYKELTELLLSYT
ncbi:DUF1878 family protein [Halobacillus litoralis]|uniref:DUF1878 family protein n=1 Tax=Halobacillus litoralis TaxID=45668 RepID=A0A845DP84_9BACI|nr:MULTISPECIES: DUF1878 family protein [Halobacillus]MCA1022580.1 YhaI family protein [Halobacillus litoralis]MYL18375.1 DUF1878 family protein [Halobacillus litoralis]MYL30618.1 DUF1878 family protein [Halobacillus halophilus]MYL38635.1 DUF1878 family protein [Halobacillus litoralis]